MRVFVYEYLTAVGVGRDPVDPLHPMYREGRAMRDALVEDIRCVLGWEAEILVLAPVDDHEALVLRIAERCDYTIVIAPETSCRLERLCCAVRTSAGQLLCPSQETIRLTSDKLSLASYWRERGVRTPATTDREPTGCEAFPVVWKPRDGAGSTATFFIPSALHLPWARGQHHDEGHTSPMILQEFVPGRAASVAFLCGPIGCFPLLPVFQTLSEDGRFHYSGGTLPMPPGLASRATRLACRAVETVPGLIGYVGVDLVLGDALDGSRDFAIEINPRLTTSYIGLRAVADFNVAESLIRIGSGLLPPAFQWRSGRIRFDADGKVVPIIPAS